MKPEPSSSNAIEQTFKLTGHDNHYNVFQSSYGGGGELEKNNLPARCSRRTNQGHQDVYIV